MLTALIRLSLLINYLQTQPLPLVSHCPTGKNNLEHSQKKPSWRLLIMILKSHRKHLGLIILNNLIILLISPVILELWKSYKRVMYLTIVTDKRTQLRPLADVEFKMYILKQTIAVLMFSRLLAVLQILSQRIRRVWVLMKWLICVKNIVSPLRLLMLMVKKFIAILILLMRRKLLL